MLAVQTAIGEPGRKVTTELSWDFNDLISIENFAYGLDENGIHLLNTTEKDNLVEYTRSFTLATTDLGVKNPKRGRRVNIGFKADSKFTLEVQIDEQTARTYTVTPLKTGLQRIRIPIGRDGQGRYFKFKISSTNAFRIDQIDGTFIVRSLGIKGY